MSDADMISKSYIVATLFCEFDHCRKVHTLDHCCLNSDEGQWLLTVVITFQQVIIVLEQNKVSYSP
jgi:hypothetical protein